MIIFWRLSGFPVLFRKVFLISIKSSLLHFPPNCFSLEYYKQNSLIQFSFVTIQRYYNDFIITIINFKLNKVQRLHIKDIALREKCPNTDQEKLRIWTLFTQYLLCILCLFHKIQKNKSSSYSFRLIPTTNKSNA